MAKTIISNIDDFLNLKGEILGTSEWFAINQDTINNFADATFDHQWIHVDTERAKVESPYRTTIAHGYLILSLLPHLLDDIIDVKNLKQLVNYGIKNMTYKNVVFSGSRIRLTARLDKVRDLGDVCKTEIYCVFEIEGQYIPALEGTIIYIYYCNS
jgi:acyl dehydratase